MHGYEFVKQDFELWFPNIINGGVIALHNTMGIVGPEKVAKEFIFGSKRFKNIRFLDSITYAIKVRENTVLDRLLNRYNVFLRYIFKIVDEKLKLPEAAKISVKKFLNARSVVINKLRGFDLRIYFDVASVK